MRIERLSNDQFKVFLTFDDLIERGFHTREQNPDTELVKELFEDMMNEASDELGIDLQGSFNLQVHMMQSQGMNVFVTQKVDEATNEHDEYIDMNVSFSESNELIFRFKEFENIIEVAHYLDRLDINDGEVYHLDNYYYYSLDANSLPPSVTEDLIAIFSEFSEPSIVSSYLLKEYGIPIFNSNSVQQIIRYFK